MKKMRPIKPAFIRDYDLFAAEQETGLPLRLAFAALLAIVDREGRFRWRSSELRVNCLPYDDIDFSRVLDTLVAGGLLVKYACDGEIYGHVPTFREHRVVNAMERASELPAPSEGVPVNHEPATGEPREGEPVREPAVSVDHTASAPAPREPEAPDPSPSEAPPEGPNGATEDPELPAGPIDEQAEIGPVEPEAAPQAEAAPPLTGGGDGLATGADIEPEGARDLAVADVSHGGVDRGDGGNGRDPEALDGAAEDVPATQAVADEDWTWQQDRELFDEIVAAGRRQGLNEAEAQEQAAASFDGQVPAAL